MTPLSRRTALGLLAATTVAPTARAEPLFLNGLGHAIGGYDPVAYFELEEATRGTLDHELLTEEGTWLFSRIEYLELFEANPVKYTPQFGGFDAEGMARGFKRRSDPTLWVLIDDKIYLHYSIVDQNRWAEDIRGNIRAAEENWKDLKDL
ncbi:MAG: YHS domain-containing (seleno)protein [Pseudomonadota bacterium]